MTAAPKELNTRVTVLEHGFSRLEHKVDAGQIESRASMLDLNHKLDTLITTGAGSKPNWYAAIGLVLTVVGITSAVFSLAEWRVGVASGPIIETLNGVRARQRDGLSDLIQLRVDIERERAIREYTQKSGQR